jgi:2-polyprenyl-3-methyl-5-hydroxy-6-metoxy-1,4-benzoquinol methylase
MEVARTAEE